MTVEAPPEPEGADPPAIVLPEAISLPPQVARQLRFFWFHTPDGEKHTHLDLTGAEALKVEKMSGESWERVRPSVLAYRMAVLEVFLARTDPEHAAERIGAMTVGALDEAVAVEWDADDDLPDQFEDGSPKAVAAP
ncbi:MAG: hypothetical protein WKF86_00155 [Acidimicrobiales bacterium]